MGGENGHGREDPVPPTRAVPRVHVPPRPASFPPPGPTLLPCIALAGRPARAGGSRSAQRRERRVSGQLERVRGRPAHIDDCGQPRQGGGSRRQWRRSQSVRARRHSPAERPSSADRLIKRRRTGEIPQADGGMTRRHGLPAMTSRSIRAWRRARCRREHRGEGAVEGRGSVCVDALRPRCVRGRWRRPDVPPTNPAEARGNPCGRGRERAGVRKRMTVRNVQRPAAALKFSAVRSVRAVVKWLGGWGQGRGGGRRGRLPGADGCR